MRSARRTFLPPALLLLLAASTATARIAPPVAIELAGPPYAAEAGQTFTNQLVITTGIEAELGTVTLAGRGWRQTVVAQPARKSLRPGEELRLDFSAVPSDPEEPLEIVLEFDGHLVTHRLDLSPASLQRAAEPTPAPTDPGSDRLDLPIPLSSERIPGPAKGADRSPPDKGGKAIDVRVRGRFVYTRPDGIEVGVDGMTGEIYDDDDVGRDHCATVVTDWDGYFDVTFSFDDYWETYPDIYIEFTAANAEAEVEHPTSGWDYRWETDVHRDVTYLNMGTMRSGDESKEPALFLLSTVTRNWRWHLEHGYHSSYVEVEWPDPGDTRYTYINEEIHINADSEWEESAATHEYGHHFEHNYGDLPNPSYCNGICDESAVNCGHCLWCEEDASIAWHEGIADYLGQVIPDQFDVRYGAPALDSYSWDSLRTCSEDGTQHDAGITEGFMAACLFDIHDSAGDATDDHPWFPGLSDQLAMGANEILAVVDLDEPDSPMDFLNGFKSRNPSVVRDLWETAANCGYDIDTADPDPVPAVWSTSHTSWPSPDRTIDMEWLEPLDDASGANAYSWHFSASPYLPNATAETVDATTCTSSSLAPGVYYFCIRSRDRAGNWSDTYETAGPYEIREAEPCDLTWYMRPGWDYPIVPRNDSGATAGSAVVPYQLIGYEPTTRWSFSGINGGESTTPDDVRGTVHLDNEAFYSYNFGAPDAMETFYCLNQGVLNVKGGRHVLHYEIDSYEDNPETDESNNTWGKQWIWTPRELTAEAVTIESAPRHMLYGWEHVQSGSLYPNCNGLRLTDYGWWNACVIWESLEGYNFDARLFMPTPNANEGFDTMISSSSRGVRHLDAFIVNNNETLQHEWDVGVVYYSPNWAGTYKSYYATDRLTGADGLERTYESGEDRWFRMYEFLVGAGDVGWLTAKVRTEPPLEGVHLQWRDEFFVYGNLTDFSSEVITGPDGTAVMNFYVTETGYNLLTVFRDPADGTDDVDIIHSLDNTPPDFRPYQASGWHSPMVPRPAADGTPSSVALPDTLHGNQTSTYLNTALANYTPVPCAGVDVHVWVDGEPLADRAFGAVPPWGVARTNWTDPVRVIGGRHTLELNIDPDQLVDEIDDGNNWYGEQYCWSPQVFSEITYQTRYAPPPRMGGWDHIESGEPRWFNCDGIRMGNPTGWWIAMAAMPGDTGNVDVRVHETFSGVKDGFVNPLAYSGWGEGVSDYVLVNFNETPRRPLDTGILNVDGDQNIMAQCAKETYLGVISGHEIFGPYSLMPGRIVQLFECYLPAGMTSFKLEALSAYADLGISLHPNDQAYQNKSLIVPGGTSWMAAAGESEEFTVDVPASDYYCVVVWKVGANDLQRFGQYKLHIGQGLTGVPGADDLPAVTAWQGAHPNPFNPQTTLLFDLAAPAATELALFDLAGRRVRTLVRETLPAGRHRVVWDGCDASGRRAASGVYLVRFRAGEVDAYQKVMLVK